MADPLGQPSSGSATFPSPNSNSSDTPSSSASLLPSALLGLLVIMIVLIGHDRTKNAFRKLPPGPKGLPFIGVPLPAGFRWLYYDSLHKKYGPIVHYTVMGKNHVILGNAELVKELFTRRSAKYSSRTNTLFFTKHIAPAGRHWVFEPDNAYWRVARKLTAPLMANVRLGKTENLQTMEATFTVVQLMQDDQHWSDHVARFASSSIMSATYGKHCTKSDDPAILDIVHLNDLVASGANPSSSPINFLPILDFLPSPLAPWRSHASKLRAKEDKLYHRLLKEAKPSTAFWARAMEGNKELEKPPVEGMPPLEPAFLAGQLVNAAAETTFITLKTIILAMCLYPSAFDSTRSQLDTIVGSERPPSFADRPNLPLVDAVLRECFRKWPSLPFGVDHSSTADDVVTVEGKDYFIPAGTLVFGSAWTIEHNPLTYPFPDSFQPERHLNPDGTLKPNEGTAFGWGRRACPGEPFADRGLWITLATMIWALSVSKVKDPKTGKFVPEEGHPWTGELISHPLSFPCKIVARSEERKVMLLKVWEEMEKDVEVLMQAE